MYQLDCSYLRPRKGEKLKKCTKLPLWKNRSFRFGKEITPPFFLSVKPRKTGFSLVGAVS